MEKEFETRCLSSLSKVFADEELKEMPYKRASALQNETFSFQVAYRNIGRVKNINIRLESDLAECASKRMVGLVPSEFPCYFDHDSNVLRETPGLYPDPLYELEDESFKVLPNQWRSVWITIDLNKSVVSGSHLIKVIFESETGEEIGSETFDLEVIAEDLPEQQLICTHWFHTDCIATQYDVEVFSEKHWVLIDQYIQTAVEHGMNMLLTPLFTPPLDTEVGAERPTVQLVDIEKTENTYLFNFDKLTRWIELSFKRGVKYIEFSHLFTQWGAKHAPKIIATVNGEEKKIFGWETEATGDEYKNFLSQFLPRLVEYIEIHKLEKNVYFHVSDEPTINNIEFYQKANELIYEYLSDFPIIDALSDYRFYEEGIVKNPIPANNHMELFLENEVPNLWTYYCCSQYKEVSNRFFNFPSARNRIIGMQLYKYNITGFLHWGYNFWYSMLSRKQIDPFRNTDADGGFPSGDAFLVYPGEEGPVESIRMEVFHDALQDLRALQLLEKKVGRKPVIELIESKLEEPLTFTEYPRESDWILSIREEINRKISEN